MEGPEPFLLAVPGLVLLVLGNFQTHPFGKGTDGVGITESFDLHLEIDDTAALMAAEAVIDTLVGSNGERSRLFSVEGAQAEEIGTGTF